MARQATWARIYETYGECPYVNIKLGEAYIKGHQGDDNDLTKKENAATCLKHFIGIIRLIGINKKFYINLL